MGNSIMIMCEQSGGRILPITYELIPAQPSWLITIIPG